MKNRFTNFDIKIIIFFSLTFFGSIGVLYFDLLSVRSKNTIQPEIATVGETSNDIRIKKSDQFDWISSSHNESIHSGDQIFSGDKSSVRILLPEGKTLEVQENSLVKFDQVKNVKNFKVSYGSIKTSVQKDEIFEVTICGKVVRIKAESSEQLTVSNEDNCKAPAIQMGEKKIQIPAKKTQSNIASIAKEIIEKSKPVQLSAPVLLETNIKLPASKSSEFIYWEKVEHADDYLVTVYDANNPNEIFYKTETEKNFFEFKTEIGSKNYQFKVEARTQQKEFINSNVVSGSVELIFNPIVILELEKTKVMKTKTSLQPADPESFNISWQKTPKSKYYKIDFYDDSQLKKLIKTHKVFSNTVKITVDNFGTQYYKISSFNSNDEQLAQSETVGKISYEKEFLLTKPSIEDSSKNLSYFFQSTEGQFVRLSWKNSQLEIAPHHYIEIATTDDFKTLIKTYKTDKLAIQIDEKIPSGKYFWRVKSYSDNIISDWSDTAKLKIQSIRAISSDPDGNAETSNTDNKNQQNK